MIILSITDAFHIIKRGTLKEVAQIYSQLTMPMMKKHSADNIALCKVPTFIVHDPPKRRLEFFACKVALAFYGIL